MRPRDRRRLFAPGLSALSPALPGGHDSDASARRARLTLSLPHERVRARASLRRSQPVVEGTTLARSQGIARSREHVPSAPGVPHPCAKMRSHRVEPKAPRGGREARLRSGACNCDALPSAPRRPRAQSCSCGRLRSGCSCGVPTAQRACANVCLARTWCAQPHLSGTQGVSQRGGRCGPPSRIGGSMPRAQRPPHRGTPAMPIAHQAQPAPRARVRRAQAPCA